MTREEIIAAAEATLILAGSSPRKETPTSLGIQHLADMLDRMRNPAFSMGKLNRWLGWMQAAVVAMGAGTLDQMKEINRPKDKGLIQGSVGREFGLTQSPAQAAEGDVRTALAQAHAAMNHVFMACPVPPAGPERRAWSSLVDAIQAADAVLSADAAGTIAAARKQAEDARDIDADLVARFAADLHGMTPSDIEAAITETQERIEEHEPWLEALCAQRRRMARMKPVPPSSPEDQEKAKAAATPTIADPDGEARS